MNRRLRLVLCGPFGPALAAAVFSELVMGMGGESVGLRPVVEELGASWVGALLVVGHGVAATAAVLSGADRGKLAAMAVPLFASTAAAVGACFVLASLPADYAYDGGWTPHGRRAQTAAGVCMMTGFFGLAALRVWRRELEAAPELRGWSPDDVRGYKVAGGLSALVLLGILWGAVVG